MDLTWSLVFRIALAALLGAILGIQRSRAGQSAGIRTNMMIAIASCLFTFLGAEAFITDGPGPQDPARVAAQIVSGVGFLGAGTLLQTKNKIRGLTTAATIWLVAAIGMTVGVGFYWGAIFVTIFGAVALTLLEPISKQLTAGAREDLKLRKLKEKQKKEELKHWWRWRQDENDDEDEHVTIED
jgi:putative Mg2+ transporter-C (MgtC) family protein